MKRIPNSGILWIYGDSLGDRFYQSIRNTSLCENVFRYCERTYNWVYNLRNNSKSLIPPGKGKNFNITRLLNELEVVLANPEMDENSVLLLNYGLHFVMTIPLDTFKTMIDSLIRMLNNSRTQFKGTIIWKTTTAYQKWKYGKEWNNSSKHHGSRRFITEQVSFIFFYHQITMGPRMV